MRKRTFLFKIKEDIHHHLLEYLLLVTSGVLYITFISVFKGQPTKQFTVTALYVLYYALWGIIHHARDQSLHLKIVLEYIAIGALALLLLRNLLM